MSSADEPNPALQKAVQVAQLPEALLQRVQRPDAIIRYQVPYARDDGEVAWVEGFRVQHSCARGVYKGGLRFHPSVSEDEVRELAFLMALKTAVCDAPAGGGKGGLIVDPKKLSEAELERLSKAFGRRLAKHIGPDIDVPAGDVGTPPKVMRWLLEGGQLPPASITSKPVEDGGDPFRDEATGFGTALCVRRHEERQGRSLEGQRVAIQGFGNVGSWCARTLQAWGAKIVAVSNSRLSILAEDGFSADALSKLSEDMPRRSEDAKGFGRVDDAEAVLGVACEILAPCAIGDAIHEGNAGHLQARVVVEGANGPVTSTADGLLEARKVPVLPGVLANGGGVCCSMYEWAANREGRTIQKDESRPRLEEQLGRAFDRVAETKEELGLSYRVAAYVVAVRKLAEAEAEA